MTSNLDGVFDAADARFDEFRIWQDLNTDGVTDAGELKTLAQAGISGAANNNEPFVAASKIACACAA